MKAEQIAIQNRIDTYQISGANLLEWLHEYDFETAPKPRRYLFGLICTHPSRQEWLDWASDVACRATFAALKEAIDIIEDGERTG